MLGECACLLPKESHPYRFFRPDLHLQRAEVDPLSLELEVLTMQGVVEKELIGSPISTARRGLHALGRSEERRVGKECRL